MSTMGGCKMLRELDLPQGQTPEVSEGEFAWEIPVSPGHWVILAVPEGTAGRELLDYANDTTNGESQRELVQNFFDAAVGIKPQAGQKG
ncbi:hypothetical protein LCGC14_0549070 [marine sediment metagenome]|uniref:Uncharacterized protein n=1 Tax=marine sediment metagenome TaxID=412755 RepID=A0A0F9RV90_9ZZZZ